MADRQAFGRLPVQRLAIGLCHSGPKRRLHYTGRDDINADRRQLDRKRARVRPSIAAQMLAATDQPGRGRCPAMPEVTTIEPPLRMLPLPYLAER
jgi:hypothetical protein